MTYETLLRFVSAPVLGTWLLMMFAPRARITRVVLHSDAVPLLMGVVYLLAMAPLLPGVLGQFDTFEHIQQAFTQPRLVFAGWIHYLAFDLLVGRMILSDSQRRGIPHLWMVPLLMLTLMLGPLGYLGYAVVRSVRRQLSPAVVPLP